MFTRLRKHLGTAGLLVAVVALVAALGGGAVAAQSGGDATASAKKKKRGKQGGLNAKQKRQVIAIAKRFQGSGPAGPAGPAGQNGAPGANGQDGAPGSNGTPGTNGDDGADGKTVLNGFGAPSNATGTDGDFYINTDTTEIWGPKAGGSWAGTGPTPLKGTDGSPWTLGGTLPNEATLTGTYAAPNSMGGPFGPGSMSDGATDGLLPIDFAIPVVPAPAFVFVPGVAGPDPGTTAFGSNPGSGCPGVTAGKVPQADPGKFCVYGLGQEFFGGTMPSADVETIDPSAAGDPGVTPAGTLLTLTCESPTLGFCHGKGLWAVTGS